MPVTQITITESDLLALLQERDASRKHITDLQTRMTEMQEAQLSRRVRAFHVKFGHPVRTTPEVPPGEEVRFRLKLVLEEFFELLEATLDPHHSKIGGAHAILKAHIEDSHIDVNLPEFADALADLDYVVEGARAVFGIHGEPIMREVQRSNLSKDAVYVEAKDGYQMGKTIKPVKPPDWVGPRVREALIEQGWRP